MISIKSIYRDIKEDKFKTWFLVALAVLFVFMSVFSGDVVEVDKPISGEATKTAQVFFHPDCPHCHKEFEFLDTIKADYPDLQITRHNISDSAELQAMIAAADRLGADRAKLGTPFFVMGDDYMIGFTTPETSGKKLIALINGEQQAKDNDFQKTIDLPVFGEVELLETSLPTLAVILGLVDGFNPCAMWVLVYLISIIAELRDRVKIWTIVGTFLAASGILYFLFMTAWLNVFLFVGYVHLLTLFIGLSAIYMGALSIYEYIKTRGHVTCDLVDFQEQKKTKGRIKELVSAPLTWASFGGIIILAFAINSIEFVCSAALPAIFTHVLTISDLSMFSYYMYILLYVFCFMLDDLIIFGFAAFAIEKFAGEKYASICKVLGGVILVGLGIFMTFFPNVLQ